MDQREREREIDGTVMPDYHERLWGGLERREGGGLVQRARAR